MDGGLFFITMMSLLGNIIPSTNSDYLNEFTVNTNPYCMTSTIVTNNSTGISNVLNIELTASFDATIFYNDYVSAIGSDDYAIRLDKIYYDIYIYGYSNNSTSGFLEYSISGSDDLSTYFSGAPFITGSELNTPDNNYNLQFQFLPTVYYESTSNGHLDLVMFFYTGYLDDYNEYDFYINRNISYSDLGGKFSSISGYRDFGEYNYFCDKSILSTNITDLIYLTKPITDYTAGYDTGYQVGYNKGYNDGSLSSYSNGYNDGYNDGFDADSTVFTVFNGILNVALVPINFFLSIFNFEILGINLKALVSAILTVSIIIIIIRMITGKKD